MRLPRSPPRPDLSRLVRESVEALKALSPVDRAIHDARQMESWVKGELRLGLDDGCGLSEERIAALPKPAAGILADEVQRLRAENAALRERLKIAEGHAPSFCED